MKQMEINDWAWAIAGVALVVVLIAVAQAESVDTLTETFQQFRTSISGTSF